MTMTFHRITWADCSVITETYKDTSSKELKADIVVPKGLEPGSHPLIVAFHGGGLMLGARNYIPYMTSWLPDFASTNNAFILSADYRLLPAAKSTDILADIESLWTWIHSALSIVITNRLPGHTVDLTQILVQGASAGGFCATHLALSHPSEVRALIAVYAMLDMYADYYVKDPAISRPILGTPKEASSSGEDVDANIQETKEERPTSKTGIEKKLVLPPFLGVCGRVLELFDGKDQLDSPMGRLQAGEKLPNRVWILHGRSDSLVPWEHSQAFVEQAQRNGQGSNIKLTIVDGPSEHGFDADWTLETEQVADGLAWIRKVWG